MIDTRVKEYKGHEREDIENEHSLVGGGAFSHARFHFIARVVKNQRKLVGMTFPIR